MLPSVPPKLLTHRFLQTCQGSGVGSIPIGRSIKSSTYRFCFLPRGNTRRQNLFRHPSNHHNHLRLRCTAFRFFGEIKAHSCQHSTQPVVHATRSDRMCASKMYRYIWLCAFYFLVAMRLDAVSLRTLPDGYTRRVWQTQDGLPENTVQAFAQTPDHYLWIGTSGGLVRFDGARFVVFDRGNTPEIRENSIFCLTVSRDGSLWAGTDGGGLLRYQKGGFRAYSAADGLTNGFVRAVYEDREGTLWAGTDDGLFRLSSERFNRADGTGKIPALAVHDIRQDHTGRLWVGGSRLVMIQESECKEFLLEGYPSATRVKSILETNDGTVWVGTVSGLQRPRGSLESGRFEKISEVSSTVRVLREDRSGTLWIGSIGGGLIRFRDGHFTRVPTQDNPPGSTVLALFEDREQNIWVG